MKKSFLMTLVVTSFVTQASHNQQKPFPDTPPLAPWTPHRLPSAASQHDVLGSSFGFSSFENGNSPVQLYPSPLAAAALSIARQTSTARLSTSAVHSDNNNEKSPEVASETNGTIARVNSPELETAGTIAPRNSPVSQQELEEIKDEIERNQRHERSRIISTEEKKRKDSIEYLTTPRYNGIGYYLPLSRLHNNLISHEEELQAGTPIQPSNRYFMAITPHYKVKNNNV